LGESVFCGPFFVGFGRLGNRAVAFVDQHFLAVMGPAFDESVASENFSTLLTGEAFKRRNWT